MPTTAEPTVHDAASARVSAAVADACAIYFRSHSAVTYGFTAAPVKSAVVGTVLASASAVAAHLNGGVSTSARVYLQGSNVNPLYRLKHCIFVALIDPQLDLVGSVVRQKSPNLGSIHTALVVERLEELLEQAVFRDPDGEKGSAVDVSFFADRPGTPASSAVGWAREFLRSAAANVIGRTRQGHVDLAQLENVLAAPVTTCVDDDHITRSQWTVTGSEFAARGSVKDVAVAAAIKTQFELPDLCVDDVDRSWLVSVSAADPGAARRALVAVNDSDFNAVDQRLLVLWDEFDGHAREHLLELDHRFVELLVTAAVSLPTKPGRAAVTDFYLRMKATVPNISRALVDAFIASVTVPVMEYTAENKRDALLAAHNDQAAAWDALAGIAARRAGMTVPELRGLLTENLAAV